MVFELFHCPTNPTSKIITWACLVRNAAPSYWGLLSRLRPTRGLSSFTPRPSWVQKQLWDNHEGTCSQRRLLPSHCQEAGLFLWDLLLVPKCTLFCLEWLDYFNGVNAVPSHNLGWACAAQFSRSWVSSLFGVAGVCSWLSFQKGCEFLLPTDTAEASGDVLPYPRSQAIHTLQITSNCIPTVCITALQILYTMQKRELD